MSSNNTFYCSFVSIHYIICECGDTFPTEDELKVHLENDHSRVKIETNEYKCATCDKIFTTEKACIMHQRVHQSIQHRIKREPKTPEELREKRRFYNLKKHVCEFCGKLYATNAALRYHQRVHTGERPYKCIMCPKAFTMPLFLQIHIRTHTGERPYQCPQCPKAFSNKAALLRHDRVHTGVKPYPCPKCGKTFTQSNSMKLHVNTVHLKMPAPYKSKARKMKEAARKMQLAEAHAVLVNEGPHIKTEPEVYESETIYAEDTNAADIYDETNSQDIYEEANPKEIYEEVQVPICYDGQQYYQQVKQEGEEILLYEEGGEEIFYEEVYEVADNL